MSERKVWLLAMPASLYKEDVKQLARDKKLKLVDLAFKDAVKECDLASETPKVTLVKKQTKASKRKQPKLTEKTEQED